MEVVLNGQYMKRAGYLIELIIKEKTNRVWFMNLLVETRWIFMDLFMIDCDCIIPSFVKERLLSSKLPAVELWRVQIWNSNMVVNFVYILYKNILFLTEINILYMINKEDI